MIDVTATIDGTAVAPQCLRHWRAASEIGSNGRSGTRRACHSARPETVRAARVRLLALPDLEHHMSTSVVVGVGTAGRAAIRGLLVIVAMLLVGVAPAAAA